MRIVVSTHIPDGLTEIRRWPVTDILAAHAAIDALEGMMEAEQRRAKIESGEFP